MLNNRGQSLILFVIILPLILLVLVFVIDIGRVITLKHELNSISELVLDYGLDYLNNIIDSNNDEDMKNNIENKIIEIIDLNKNDIDYVDVRFKNNEIYIKLNDRVNGIFSSIVGISVFDISSCYVGYLENNEKRIERVNG